MPAPLFFIIFLSLTILSYLICKYLVHFSHKHAILDDTTSRSSHTLPTPRIGGVSFVIVILLELTIYFSFSNNLLDTNYYLALLIPPSVIALVSVVDDVRKGISRIIRLGVHLIASALAMALLNTTPYDLSGIIVFILSVVAVAWFINLFNFMDGIDGIAATQAIFIIGSLAGFSLSQTGLFQLHIFLIAPLLGFAIINWQPAKIFMGDIGSTFLGVLIAILLILGAHRDVLTIWSCIILTSTFLVDSSWTLLVRVITGQRWHQPHRSHLYQILSRKTGSHKRICLWNLAFNLSWILPLSVAASTFPYLGQVFTLFAMLPILVLCIMHRAGRAESN